MKIIATQDLEHGYYSRSRIIEMGFPVSWVLLLVGATMA